MGFTALISRIPAGNASPQSHYDEDFVVANNYKIKKAIYPSDNKDSRARLLVQIWKTTITQDYVISY